MKRTSEMFQRLIGAVILFLVFTFAGHAAALDLTIDGVQNAGDIGHFNERAASTGFLPAGDYRIFIKSGAIDLSCGASLNTTAISFRVGEDGPIFDLGVLSPLGPFQRYSDFVIRTPEEAFQAYLISGNAFQNITLPAPAELLFYFIDDLQADNGFDNCGSLVVSVEPPAVPVAIDIKPGSFPNSINPRSRGVIPVAILTTDTFDASTVNPTTVLFGATGTEAAPRQAALEDVDADGDTDLILHFKTQDTGIVCGNTSGSLTGQTVSGQAIQGSNSLNTVGCK